MFRGMRWPAVAIGGLLVLGAAGMADAAGEHKYVGASKCKSCHKKELIGNQYGEWEKGDHAKAFETLKGDKAAEIAKEKGLTVPPHESDDCLKCHVTAFGVDEALFSKKPLDHKDGIQCESCHGPGSDYKKKKTMADRDKAMAAGLWEADKDEKICTTCHNDESPTWDPAVGFNYEEAKEKIAHLIPEDVKGKYLEIEEQKKKERRARGEAVEDEDEEEDE